MAVRFGILGPLEAWEDGREPAIGPGRQRALLALLVVHANEPVSADRLVEELWAGAAPASAQKVLQGYVSQLRRALPAETIVTRGSGYELRADDVDALAFERLVERARSEAPERAVESLREALGLWRGRALAEFEYESWAQAEIGRLEELRLAAIEGRIDVELRLGGGSALVPELERLVAEHPLRERLRGQLMLALYRSGRQAEALEVYRDARRVLDEELGLTPSPFLEQLERQILTHDAELGAERPRFALPEPIARRGRLIAVAGVLLLAGAAGALAWQLAGGSPAAAAGNAVVLLQGGRIERVPLDRAPASVAAGGGSVWVTDADDATISRVDERRRRVVATAQSSSTPTAVSFGAGALWLANGRVSSPGSQLVGSAYPESVSRLDSASAVVTLTHRLPATTVDYSTPTGANALAATREAVWAIGPDESVVRMDPADGRIVATIRGLGAQAIAASERAVWVDDGYSMVARIDPSTNRVTARITLAASSLGGIALGGGALWVADPRDGTVWRVDFEPNLVTRTASVGIGVTSVAFAAGSVWAGNPFEGTVAQIDPATSTVVRTFGVGGAPQSIAVDGPAVWVAVAGVPAPGPRVAGVESLPSRTCGPVVSGGGKARFLIASDLPLTGASVTATVPMTRAIALVLQRHGFRAGKYAIAYQSCDDATAQAGNFDFATCGSNAKSYARDRDLLGVIGPYNSDCARVEIPILNLARGAPVALVGTLTTNDGLTRKGPESLPGELKLLYPTGRRNFVRIIAPDAVQGAALALLAHQLGLRHVEVLSDGSDYGETLGYGFVRAARQLGVGVAGTARWGSGGYESLAARIAAGRPDGVLVGGYDGSGPARLVRALHARLGPRVPLFAGDGFLTIPLLLQHVGAAAARGMYVSFAGRPNERLPAAGRAFVNTFAETQPSRGVASWAAAYGAQAAEVLLSAIARSDGTRASVVRELLLEKVRGGILGDFSFTSEGDMTPSPVTIFRVVGGNQRSSTGERDFQGSVVDRVVDVPLRLVEEHLDSRG